MEPERRAGVAETRDEPNPAQEPPPVPMDVQEIIATMEEQANNAQMNENTHTREGINRNQREEREALFEQELARIDEALGLSHTVLDQPHTTIEKVAQLTNELVEPTQELHAQTANPTSPNSTIYITTTTNGITSAPSILTPTLVERTICEIPMGESALDNTIEVRETMKNPKWKKRARQAPSTSTISQTVLALNGVPMNTKDVEESVEDDEAPLTKRRNTRTKKDDINLRISAEAAAQLRREL
ncbi:hypothetical protein FCV25MIE_09306 [Fagus crenata]